MLDIKFVRENPEIVKQNIRNKFQDNKLELVDKVIELDKENREIKQEVEALRAERNKTSKQIGALMADASAGRLAALQSHRAALLCRRAQMDALLATLDKTILTEEGKCAMTDAEKFEGFKQKLVAENEAEYGAEARGKYGDTAVDASNAKLMGLSPEQYGEMQKLSARINAALAAAVRAGEAPDGPEGRRIAGLHKQWLCFTWPKYTPKAHLGLAEMYVADERFTAYYDAETPGCAAFLRDAVAAFTGC